MKDYVLCLDSSDRYLSVGIGCDGALLTSIRYEAWQKQSEFMVEEISSLCQKLCINPHDFKGVSISKGPGSYTGIRIALTVGKVIAFSLQIPLYLSSSLEALRNLEKPSICLFNARSKRSYFAVYGPEGVKEKDTILTNEEVLSYIASHPDYVLCGDLAYLGLKGEEGNELNNLLHNVDEEHRIDNVHKARPVYLKDDYDKDHFNTIIRKAMIADLDAIEEISNSSFVHTSYKKKDFLYDMQENPVGYFLSAIVDDKVVGFIDFFITFNSATIALIAVKEEYRGKGIGNLLLGAALRECEAQLEPVEFLTLEVRKSNLNAQKFYKKHKFELVTTKKSYYEDGEDALYFVRSLIHG